MSEKERGFARESLHLASLCGLIMFYCSSGFVTQEIQRLLLLMTNASADCHHLRLFIYAKQLHGTLSSLLLLPSRGLRQDVEFVYPWEWSSTNEFKQIQSSPHHWDLLIFEATLAIDNFAYESDEPRCGSIGYLGLDINLSVTAHQLCESRANETHSTFRYGVEKPVVHHTGIQDDNHGDEFDEQKPPSTSITMSFDAKQEQDLETRMS